MSNNNALLTHGTELEEAWDTVLAELESAGERSHPFRYLTLATIDGQLVPDQRMVVLRAFDGSEEFVIFTDIRSKKIKQLKGNRSVSLLFYDPEKKIQVSVKGQASIINEGDEHQRFWEKSASDKPHSYTSLKAPGSPIDEPKEAYEWDLENPENFCVLKIKAFNMTFLQLNDPRHLRSERRLEDGSWKSEWIAP